MENQKKEKTTEASLEKQQKKLKNRKKLKYGGLATAITVIFVAVVVLVNVVVTQLDKRFPNAKLDLTTANLYEISDETLDYIRNLDKDVDVAISSDEATFTSDKYNKMIAETLSKYQGYSDRINVTYFDTTKDPDVLSKYQELYGGSIQSGQIIINSGKESVIDAVRQATDGSGADAAIDITGAEPALNSALKCLRAAGRLVCVGLPTKPITFHDMTDDLVYREVQLTGVSGRKIWETWEDFAKVVQGPWYKMDQVIGGRFALEDYEKALEQIRAGVPGKMILYP